MIAGCEEIEPGRKQAPIEGVKLSDLQPTDIEFEPPQINLDLVAFEMPAENLQTVTKIFDSITDSQIILAGKDRMKANGFKVALGYSEQWQLLVPLLHQARARKANTNKLLIIDSQGEDIYIKNIYTPYRLSYINASSYNLLQDLPPGRAIFRVKAAMLPERKRLASVKLQALYKSSVSDIFTKANDNNIANENILDFASMRMKMNEGDFILLAPEKHDEQPGSLENLFFSFTGDYPEATPNKTDNESGPSIVVKHNVPLVRIYMLVCMKVTG